MAGIPKQIGPYLVEESIEKGGFAYVYKAKREDVPSLHYIVKMSRAPRSAPDSREYYADALNQEADILRQLDHPGIVHIYRIPGHAFYVARATDQPGQPEYFAMEYLPGGSVKDLTKSHGRLPLEMAVEIAYQVASALEYMHLRGFAHRDLKPENVLFRRPPSYGIEAVLVDFGVAVEKGVSGDRAMTLITAAPERVRQVRGELPPEQVLDPFKMDVYSLGVLLYYMLTGRFPFESGNENRLTTAILGETPVPPTKYNPGIPHQLEELILDCLEKNPDSRPDARRLIERLNQAVPPPRQELVPDEESGKRTDQKSTVMNRRRPKETAALMIGGGLVLLLLMLQNVTCCGLTVNALVNRAETSETDGAGDCEQTSPAKHLTSPTPPITTPVASPVPTITLIPTRGGRTPVPSAAPTITLVPTTTPR